MAAPKLSPAEEVVLYDDPAEPLRIPKPLVADLLNQVNEGIRSETGEVGGLLVGSAMVERMVPVSPTAPDTAIVREAAAHGRIRGFYRSWTRGETRLRESDLEIFRFLEETDPAYAANCRFFVVLAPVSEYVLSAEIALRGERGWGRWQTRTLGQAGGAGFEPAGRISPVQFNVPEPLAATAPGRAAQPAYPIANRVPLWLSVGAAAVVLAGAFEIYGWIKARQHPPVQITIAPPATAVVRTGFSANQEGSAWKLSWQPDAVAALQPTSVVISIRDGDNDKQIPLTPGDLASGTLLYTPRTGDLLFRFLVVGANSRPVEEHIRVVSAAPTETPVPAHAPAPARQQPRPFDQPKKSPVQRAAAPEIPSPPPLASRDDTGTAAGFVGPIPNRQATASQPADFSSPQPASVQVRVEIDAAGKVVKVTPVAENPENPRLVEAALEAAKAWLFQPARQDGRPVPSEMVLNFRFSGQ